MARIVLGLIALLTVSGCGMTVIEDGQVGVKADFGKISDEALASGWHFYVPFTSWVETWNVKTQ
ncbi:MAG: hypothetical protein HY737_03045, partial [Candidatus Omnitrophica bacterium]|nr:hypothetical protein [Candidatus Omnitrophota bacterium]